MNSYKRSLDLSELVKIKSFFLFGPRQVGKTTLLGECFPDSLSINLLKTGMFRSLSANPGKIRELIAGAPKTGDQQIVVIDEIQKLPILLDEVQDLMESDRSLRFVMTGSSARKLKRSGANLLGGRARWLALHPISYLEYLTAGAQALDTIETLVQWGGLPSVLNSSTKKEDLNDYIGTYLKEEIQAEALVRNIGAFSRFLQTAALLNAKQIMFSNVASDAEVPARTVREYFDVLEDTLIGKLLAPFGHTVKRKAVVASKFYFFDVGLANAMVGRWSIQQGTPEYGDAFEHWIWRELDTAIAYRRLDVDLSYWRSTSKFEVDFVVTPKHKTVPELAIEVKAKKNVGHKDLSGLLAFAEDFSKVRKIVVSLESMKRITTDGVEIWPVLEFIRGLWNGEIL